MGKWKTDPAPLRVVLLGKTGAGKSATGNTILGVKDAFKEYYSPGSVTKTCCRQQIVRDGYEITVVDTPGLCDTSEAPEKTEGEIERCIELLLPGPHVFLLVMRLDVRYTEEERNTVEWIQQNFGREAYRYTIVLFTHGDILENRSISEYLSESPPLLSLIECIGGRCHVFDNGRKNNTEPVRELLGKITSMLETNRGKCYTSLIFQSVQLKVMIAELSKQKRHKEKALKEAFDDDQRTKMKILKGLSAGVTLTAAAAVGAVGVSALLEGGTVAGTPGALASLGTTVVNMATEAVCVVGGGITNAASTMSAMVWTPPPPVQQSQMAWMLGKCAEVVPLVTNGRNLSAVKKSIAGGSAIFSAAKGVGYVREIGEGESLSPADRELSTMESAGMAVMDFVCEKNKSIENLEREIKEIGRLLEKVESMLTLLKGTNTEDETKKQEEERRAMVENVVKEAKQILV